MSMPTNIWMKVAGVSGAVAVTLGAIGAHAFKDQSEQMRDTWRVATNYHFVHTLALGLSAVAFTGRKRNIVCGLFTCGIMFFSGACYLVVLNNERKPYSSFAPIGGFSFIAGWLAFAFL